MEKADYNRAVDDIKNIFGQLRKQSQKIEEAILAVRRNALFLFRGKEYGKLVEDNISTVVETREKFRLPPRFYWRKNWRIRRKADECGRVHGKRKANLGKSQDDRTVSDTDAGRASADPGTALWPEETVRWGVGNYSNMTLVQRFPFRSDVYDKILKDASLLKNADKIFAPLFSSRINKIFNPEKWWNIRKS